MKIGPEKLIVTTGANYKTPFKRRRKRKTRGEADAEKGEFVQGDDGRGHINPAVLAAAAASRDPEKLKRERRRRHREPRSDEEVLVDDRRNPEKVSRRRRKRHEGGETFVVSDRSKTQTRPEIIVDPPGYTAPPIVDPRRMGPEGRYSGDDGDEIVVVEDHDGPRIRGSSRAPPPMTTRQPLRAPSADPSQREYTMEDIIFTQAPGRSQGSRAASRPPPPPASADPRRSHSGPQFPVEDEIVVEEDHEREPRRKNRGYERREYPIIEDISALENSRLRGGYRPAPPPPPPPSGFSSNPGVKQYRRDRSASESGSGIGSARDSGFDERDGNLKGRRDRDREAHVPYARRDGERDLRRD